MAAEEEKMRSQPDAAQIQLVPPEYWNAVRDCAVPGSYSSAWTILALTLVLQRNIDVTYPPVNGKQDENVGMLGRTFGEFDGEPLHVLWGSMQAPAKYRIWVPDHFIALPRVTQFAEPQSGPQSYRGSRRLAAGAPIALGTRLAEPPPLWPSKNSHACKSSMPKRQTKIQTVSNGVNDESLVEDAPRPVGDKTSTPKRPERIQTPSKGGSQSVADGRPRHASTSRQTRPTTPSTGDSDESDSFAEDLPRDTRKFSTPKRLAKVQTSSNCDSDESDVDPPRDASRRKRRQKSKQS